MTQPPFNRFIMLGSMRSGSNLLEKYLNQYSGLICRGELFQKSFIGKQRCQNFLGVSIDARNENPQQLLDRLKAKHPRKITGFRFFQDHDKRVLEAALVDPFCAKIILTRDPIESFVSLQIALKTQQWLVSDIAHRKEVQIQFDLEAFATYQKHRAAYYAEIHKSLAATEQPYFEIDYSMLNTVENVNRLAAFIGDRQGKTTLNEPIKKQNPGRLSSKIINIDEVRAALDTPSLHDGQPPIIKPVFESGTDLSRAYFCKNLPLAFGPIPGVPDLGVRNWLEAQDKRPPQNGFTAHRFSEWQAQHKDTRFFSVVRHPVLRAYNAFSNKIFATEPDGYVGIRKVLEDQFGMFLPQGQIAASHNRRDLERAGYGVGEHRISFKLFLIFVAANLNNETKIRQDGKWQLQSEIIRRYRILHPEVLVLKEKSLELGLQYLENRMDLPPVSGWKNQPDPAYTFTISQIYDEEIEALTLAAYGPDYQDFRYGNLIKLPASARSPAG